MKGLEIMKMNDKIKIIVSEPWNFTSSDGDNLFYCKVDDINKTDTRELVLAKAISAFKIRGSEVKNVVLQPRNTQDQQYNIYLLPKEYCLDDFQNDNSIGQKLIFAIIGVMK